MATNSEWYFCKQGSQFGPISSSELKRMARSGDLLPSDLVWKEGMAEWKPASTFRKLFNSEGNSQTSATPPPLPASHPLDRASMTVQEAIIESVNEPKNGSTELTKLQAKWKAVFHEDTSPLEFLLAEAFTQMVAASPNLHRFPEIPPKKLANAKEKYAKLSATEKLLGLFDDTIFRTATEGFALTTRGIYWHSMADEGGHRDFAEITPADVAFQKSWSSKSITITSKDRMQFALGDQAFQLSLVAFIKLAAAITLAADSSANADHKSLAKQSLAQILSDGSTDGALAEVVRSFIELPDLLIEHSTDQLSELPVNTSANDVLIPATPQMNQELASRGFPRTKEDLRELQLDVQKWFESKKFAVSLHYDKTVQIVSAAKESLLRNIGGNRQNWIVKIEQHATEYSVTLGWGAMERRNVGEMALTAVANFCTYGVPAIAGQYEAYSVRTEFWKWLEERSKNVCPSCEKSGARQGPFTKVMDATTDEEDFYDEEYEVTTRTNILEYSCRYCSATWTEGDAWTSTTFEWCCPECDHSDEYDCVCLDEKSEIVCKGCGEKCFTDAQEEYQHEQEIAAYEAMQSLGRMLDSAATRIDNASKRVCPWCGGRVLGGAMGKIARDSSSAFSKCYRCGKTLPD